MSASTSNVGRASGRSGFARLWRSGSAVVGFAAVALFASACVPPPPHPPELPAGVGVSWLRDAGGGPGEYGSYRPAYEEYSVLDGVADGPSVPSSPPLPPAAGVLGYVQFLPDGNASFPWNGFAGEGITTTKTPVGETYEYELTFPGGTCTFIGYVSSALRGLIPSPDGTRLATVRRDIVAGGTSLSIVELTPGCPSIVGTSYPPTTDADDPSVANPAVVWSPDSSHVLYQVAKGFFPYSASSMVKLEAASGAVPETVWDADGVVTPLGWSIGDRLLFNRVAGQPDASGAAVSTIETMRSTGGDRKVIDTARFPEPIVQSILPFYHYGYLVPGTSIVAYNDGSTQVTNPTGQSFPYLNVHLYDVATGGEQPLLGSVPPVVWHTETQLVGPDIEVPNIELVSRFVR